MAKVMVSLPDDVLRAVDAAAAQQGTSRSGLLRELAESSFRSASRARAERMAALTASRPASGHGGEAADTLHAHRPQR